jgi:polyisoprenyl-teichoic acid--peptidoglycan teichoic acid transferase
MAARRSLDSSLFFSIVIAVTILGTAVILYLQVRTDQITEARENDQDLVFLVVIHDEDRTPVFTQVFFCYPVASRGGLVDIPGNVGTIIPSLNRMDRIDTVYIRDGIDAYRRSVGELLGTDIPFHITMSLDGLERVVDLTEGLQMFIATSYSEDQETLLLPGGNVVLDGRKARTYLMYSDSGERDVERIGRTQNFTRNLFRSLGDNAEYLQKPTVTPFLLSAVTTNLDKRSMLSFLNVLASLNTDRMLNRRVQGTVRSVETDGRSIELLFPHFEGQWLKETVRQIRDSLRSEDPIIGEGLTISIEILNGTGIAGLARRTRELFEGYGFDVVTIGNAESSGIENTEIINRTGEAFYAERTAEIIKAHRIRDEEAPMHAPRTIDVTVVLGSDFDGRFVR